MSAHRCYSVRMAGVEDRLEQILRSHGVEGVSSEALLRTIDTVLAGGSGVHAPLTAAEENFLRDFGGPGAGGSLDERNAARDAATAAADAARRASRLAAGSLSLAEAAERLGVDRSRVSRRCSTGRLYSFTLDGTVRIPRWQLAGDRLLPGLEQVVPAIPAETTPLLIEAVMTAPQEETGSLPPVDFLAEGGAPRVVVEMVADLARW